MLLRSVFSFLLLNFLVENPVSGENILVVFSAYTKSHIILGHALVKALIEKGHTITMVSPYPMASPPKNYTEILIKELNSKFYWDNTEVTKSKFELNNDYFSFLRKIGYSGPWATEQFLEEPKVQDLLKSNASFDSIIVALLFNEALYALGDHFKCPIIALSTVGLSWTSDYLVGNPNNPAYMPLIALTYKTPMNFFERFINTLTYIYLNAWRTYIYLPRQESIKNKYFPNTPSLDSMLKNISLVFTNSHHSLSYPKPLVPNLIEIGGFHVQPSNQLSDDLKTFLNEAEKGVVYFSMGSNLNSASMPLEKQKAFLEAFSMLEQKVLWKWEANQTKLRVPKNVKLSKWLPQQDILNHPNVKVFISHVGLLSLIESTHFGVPIIGIPMYADQFMNLMTVVNEGYGLRIDYENITTKSIYWAINETLKNEKYMLNAKKQSIILKDQPLKPIDNAVFWVEHVMRHQGTQHLRSPILYLSLFQILLFDIFGTIILFLISFVIIIYLLARKSKSKRNYKLKQY